MFRSIGAVHRDEQSRNTARGDVAYGEVEGFIGAIAIAISGTGRRSTRTKRKRKLDETVRPRDP